MPRRKDMHRGRITDYSAQDMRDPVQLRRAMDDYIGKSGLYDRTTRREMVELVASQAERSIAANDQNTRPAAGRPANSASATGASGSRAASPDFSRFVLIPEE